MSKILTYREFFFRMSSEFSNWMTNWRAENSDREFPRLNILKNATRKGVVIPFNDKQTMPQVGLKKSILVRTSRSGNENFLNNVKFFLNFQS